MGARIRVRIFKHQPANCCFWPKILVSDTFSGRLGTQPPSNPTLVGLHVGAVACVDAGGIVAEFAADL